MSDAWAKVNAGPRPRALTEQRSMDKGRRVAPTEASAIAATMGLPLSLRYGTESPSRSQPRNYFGVPGGTARVD